MAGRMTPEPSEGWKPLDDGTREYLIDGCPGIDDAFYFELAPKLWGALMYTEQRLRAVEQENRVLRDAAAEALGYLTQLRETSDAFSRMECASRAHAVLDGALARAGGGADAAV